MKNKYLATQRPLSKWFLALFVCFGFFVFTGGLSNTQPGQHRAVQTELVIGAAQNNNKRLVHYHYRINSYGENEFFNTPSFNTLVLINYHRSLQTKFKLLRHWHSNRHIEQFSPLKTIPQDFKKSSLPFLLG